MSICRRHWIMVDLHTRQVLPTTPVCKADWFFQQLGG